jgi:selenocysteine lyase/cysteine desulfurase
MGSGALIFRKHLEISPCIFGGTGTESFSKTQPKTYPEALESGPLSLPSIVSLLEGVSYVKRNVEMFGEILYEMSETLCKELNNFDKIKLYSTPNRSGIVSFSLEGFSSAELANVLSSKYDIAVRGGLHCAPLMHQFLKTEDDGLLRASLSPQNTKKEIGNFILAIKEILSFIS